MAKPEVLFDQYYLNRLLNGGTSEVYLTVPERSEVVPAKNLKNLPAPEDAVINEIKHRYTTLPIEELSLLYQQKDDAEVLPSGSEEKVLFIFSDAQLNLTLDNPKKLDRQIQRIAQFEHLNTLITKLERHFDDNTFEDLEFSPSSLLPIYKDLAVSWYRDELSQEPFTKKSVDEMATTELPEPQEMVESVEHYLREISFSLPDVFQEVSHILKNPKQEKKVKKIGEKKKTVTQEEDAQIKNEQEKKEKEDFLGKIEEIRDGTVNVIKARRSESLYSYDAELDEPSAEAAEFVQELWERPF